MAGVTVRVVGDEDGFRGPYYITTGADGSYGMVIAEVGKVPERVEFKAEIFGEGVDSRKDPKWSVKEDCHSNGANQVMKINWSKVHDD